VSSGLPKLDEMLGGGFLPGTLAVVYGAAGIGYAQRLFHWPLRRWEQTVLPISPLGPDRHRQVPVLTRKRRQPRLKSDGGSPIPRLVCNARSGSVADVLRDKPLPGSPDPSLADSWLAGAGAVGGRHRRGILQPAAGTEDRHRDDGLPDRRPPAQRSRSATDRLLRRSRRRLARVLTGEGGLDHASPRRHGGEGPLLAPHGLRRGGLRRHGALPLTRPALEPADEQIEEQHQNNHQQEEEDLLGPERSHGANQAIASGSAEAPALPRRSLPAWWCRPARSSSGSSP